MRSRLPAPDTQLLYRYLRMFGGISVPHASATDMGTDWRDNDPQVEPVVEIYQGQRQNYEREDAPRAAKPGDAINNWRAAGTVTAALDKGYRLGFVASSDHHSTHIAYANVLAAQPTREAILEAIRQRHVYASTDNIVADVRSGDHLPGDKFSVDLALNGAPIRRVKTRQRKPLRRTIMFAANRLTASSSGRARCGSRSGVNWQRKVSSISALWTEAFSSAGGAGAICFWPQTAPLWSLRARA